MKKNFTGLLFFCFTLLCFSSLHANETITWIQPHFPPYVIKQGQFQKKGIDNQIVEKLKKELNDYNHFYETGNYQRALSLIKSKQLAAITPLFRTPEREQYVHYTTIPSYLVLPNGLVINKKSRDKFTAFIDSNGLVDVEALIQSKSVVIGISLGRSYSGILDEMIRKYKRTGAFVERSGNDVFSGLLKMLNLNRLDALFGFPVETQYVAREIGLDSTQFEVLPVKSMEAFTPVYTGLPKTQEGVKIAKYIDDFLKKKGVINQFSAFYEYWLDDGSKERYRKLMEKYYSEKLGYTP